MGDSLTTARTRALRSARTVEARGLPDRVLTIEETCALLGISRACFYRDREWVTLRDRPSAGRVGVRLSAVMAELDRRRERGDTATVRAQRAPRVVPDADDATPARGYVRRKRRVA